MVPSSDDNLIHLPNRTLVRTVNSSLMSRGRELASRNTDLSVRQTDLQRKGYKCLFFDRVRVWDPPIVVDGRFTQIASACSGFVGLLDDGTAVQIGHEGYTVIPEVKGEKFVSIATGGEVIGHSIGLRSDGTAIGWGHNSSGQCDVPRNEKFTQVKCCDYNGWGLREDGTLVVWGKGLGCASNLPIGEKFVDVCFEGGGHRGFGLRADGTVLGWWKERSFKVEAKPMWGGVVPEAEKIVQIDSGSSFTVGIREDGVPLALGGTTPPRLPETDRLKQIYCGISSLVGIREDGSAFYSRSNSTHPEVQIPQDQKFIQFAAYAYSRIAGLVEDC